MNRKFRLLMSVNSLRFFMSHWYPIAKAAKDHGYDVHVATPVGEDLDVLAQNGLIHHEVPIPRSVGSLGGELAAFRQFCRIYRRVKPDIVHHVTIKPIIYGSLAGRLTGSPAQVAAVTGLGILYVGNKKWKHLARWGLARYLRLVLKRDRSVVCFENPVDREIYIESRIINREATELIRSAGVDTNLYTPAPEPAGLPVVVLPARMLWSKGLGYFVRAAEIINRAGPVAEFVLAGDVDRNPSAVSREQLETWHKSGVVKWLGYCREMARLYQESHIVCLPTYYREGLPKTLLEAAACGRPVVATDIPGCNDFVVDGETGLIVPPKDLDALVKALIRLIQDPSLRRSMGEKGRAMVEEQFSLDYAASRILSVYQKVIENKE